MPLSMVNEKELGESIATNLGPKLEAAQARLESWVDGMVDKLATRYAAQIQVPLGDRTLTVRVELVPKP